MTITLSPELAIALEHRAELLGAGLIAICHVHKIKQVLTFNVADFAPLGNFGPGAIPHWFRFPFRQTSLQNEQEHTQSVEIAQELFHIAC